MESFKNVLVENDAQVMLLSTESELLNSAYSIFSIWTKTVCLPVFFCLFAYKCIYTHIFVYEQTCFFNLEETLLVTTEHRSTGLRSDIFIMYMCLYSNIY